ncbi:hypothetical protein L6452_28586 [Arctium lappa]|uniref:Uncharacterized protein n=1 Tax=Arctium lappa TaxID=4217 RepID=A0ACB8ZZQ8_ARCLA|nr:hypothetical protein L6452_28586 [Arctium lappa]
MSSTKVAGGGAMMVHNICRHTLLQATRPPRSGNGFLGGCFTSVSTPPPEGIGEKAKQTMDNVLGAAKDNTQQLKDRVMGKTNSGSCSSASSHPSKDPNLNHGVELTDSSCEDVRDRPGGYS